MRGTGYVFSSLGGGINREAAPYAITENQGRDSLNYHSTPVGVIKKRNGCPLFSSPVVGASNHLTSLFALHTSIRWLVGAGGTKLFKIDTAGTSADLQTGLTSNLRWEFIQAPTATGPQGPLYGINGTDSPQQWDGSAGTSSTWTTAGVTAIPNGKYMTYHNNRVVITGVTSNPSRVYLSKLLDPRGWELPDAVTVDLEPGDGQDITGVGHIGPYLLIFKPRKTYVITDSDLGSFRSISSETGCVANRSIVETEGGTYFYSSDGGVIVTDGNTIQDISLDVRPILKNIGSTSSAKPAATYYNGSYFLSIPESTIENSTTLEYDLTTQSWWPHKFNYATSSTTGTNQFTILNPSTTSTLYAAFADTVAPQVAEMFKINTYQDFGAYNFTSRWDGPWHVFSQPHQSKNLREIRADGLGEFTVYTARSFSSTFITEEAINWEVANPGSTFGGSGIFGGGGVFGDTATITERRYYTPGTARAFSLRFESINNLDCQIYSYTMAVDLRAD